MDRERYILDGYTELDRERYTEIDRERMRYTEKERERHRIDRER